MFKKLKSKNAVGTVEKVLKKKYCRAIRTILRQKKSPNKLNVSQSFDH